MFFIKAQHPELIDRYQIPLDEYPPPLCRADCRLGKRKGWNSCGRKGFAYALQRICVIYYGVDGYECTAENRRQRSECRRPDRKSAVRRLRRGSVSGGCLRRDTCRVGRLPVQLAAMNMTNINVQLLTIEAAVTRKKSTFTRRDARPAYGGRVDTRRNRSNVRCADRSARRLAAGVPLKICVNRAALKIQSARVTVNCSHTERFFVEKSALWRTNGCKH